MDRNELETGYKRNLLWIMCNIVISRLFEIFYHENGARFLFSQHSLKTLTSEIVVSPVIDF